MKLCEFCKIPLSRKRKPCGKLEANTSFGKRRFCNYKCRGNFTASKNECLESSARQRTLKLFPKSVLKSCSICRSTERKLQRHHIDKNPFNNESSNILICCQLCHVKEHQKTGVWGRGKKEKKCTNCNSLFIHKNRHRKTCSEKCFRDISIKSAKKRWECGST